MKLNFIACLTAISCLALACHGQKSDQQSTDQLPTAFTDEKGRWIEPLILSDSEWKKRLSKERYEVLRHEATERAFTGKYWDEHTPGVYTCAGCGLDLFTSETKFESGTGWPSFYAPIDETHIEVREDRTLGMTRTEVHCRRCGGHLGHVFTDGPKPGGLRYCINSVSLDFDKD